MPSQQASEARKQKVHAQNVRAAKATHDRITAKLRGIMVSKIEVYLLLSAFKKSRLYRYLDLPMSRRHAEKICAERRFTTWEDYLARLGRAGISFGYFAELERLEREFGTPLVKLCILGIPVETRRFMLRARRRAEIQRDVQEILDSGMDDAARVEKLINWMAVRQSQEEHCYDWPRRHTPGQRVARYHRHAAAWERKLSVLVDQMSQVPHELRTDRAYSMIVHAWREVFELHVDTGRRLAGHRTLPVFGDAHAEFLERVQEAWRSSEISAYIYRDRPSPGYAA